MSDLQCPYCDFEFDYDGDYEFPETEEDCPNCGKTFGLQIEHEPTYICSELPCANGEPHKMRAGFIFNGKQTWKCQYPCCSYTEKRDIPVMRG